MPLPPHTYRKEVSDEPVRISFPEREEDKRFHIFQSSENARMLHALQNWNWFERDKPKLLRYLSEITQRPVAMLRMDSGWKHRLKMENIEALDSVMTDEKKFRSSSDYVYAKQMLSKDFASHYAISGDEQWKRSLRNNWGKVEVLRDGYFHWHHDNKIGLIRIGDPKRDTIPTIVFFKANSRQDRKRRDWGDFEWFIQELEEAIAKAQLFYPLFWYLKVKGIPRRAPSWWPYGVEDKTEQEEEMMMEEAAETIDYIDSHIDLRDPPIEPTGPKTSFSRRDLLFCVKPGGIDERTITVKNKGSVALFYSWERRPVQPLVLPGRKKEAGERLFTLMCGTGSVLPGQSRKFHFKFYSNQIGTHMEIWMCRIYPKPKIEVKPVRLKGVTLFDGEKRRRWRTLLERILEYREMMRGIGEALHDIMENAARASRPTAELRDRQYINCTAAYNFMRKNLKLNPPLFFTPSNYTKLEKLAQTLMPDGIIPGTAAKIDTITTAGELQSEGPKEATDTKKMKKGSDIGKEKTTKISPPQPESKAPGKKGKEDKKNMKGEDAGEEKAPKVSPPEMESKAPAKQGKEDKKKKGKSGVEILAPASLPETDGTALGDAILHREITREDMFCKPCFDTYIRPVPPSPPPPPAAWAGSVVDILLAIKACPERKQRRALKLEVRTLLEAAAIPPHQTSLLLMAMYKALSQVSSDFERVMETVSEETGRPVVEQLLKTYYDQIEAEQVAAEEAERQRDLAGEGDLDWPFEEDDPEEAMVGDAMRKEAQAKQAREMLHYVMRWIHVLTEAKCVLENGFDGFQAHIDKDQAVVTLLIEEKLHDLSLLGMDDDACWAAFDLERKKQVLKEELVGIPTSHNCPDPILVSRPASPNCPTPTTVRNQTIPTYPSAQHRPSVRP